MSVAIRLRFVAVSDIISWVIRSGQLGFRYSHVDLVLPDGRYLAARSADGVQIRAPGYDADRLLAEIFVAVPATREQADAFYASALAEIGKPYDYGAILDFALGSLRQVFPAEPDAWRSPASWFCSELGDDKLEEAGVLPRLASTPRRVTVRDLFMRIGAVVPGTAWRAS